jgi:hypothetical protein
MKFTHQIKFNSVPEWRDHYIDYAHLKKIIYAIAKAEADEQQQHHLDEEHPLLSRPQTAHGEKVGTCSGISLLISQAAFWNLHYSTILQECIKGSPAGQHLLMMKAT